MPEPAVLHIGNDCGPCCECDDFVRVQRGILRTWDRFVAIGVDAEASRDVFQTVVDRWQLERECIEAKVVTVYPVAFGNGYVEVIIGICNHTRECLLDTTLELTVSTTGAGEASIVPGATQISGVATGMISYSPSGEWPIWVSNFDSIQAMGSGVLRTRLALPDAVPGDLVTISAAASTTSPIEGLNLPQTTVASVVIGG